MSILAAYIVPHPPLIVPAVGQGQERKIQATTDSYRAIAQEISDYKPDTIVVLSPHATVHTAYFHISPTPSASGNLKQFGANTHVSVAYDQQLVEELSQLCDEKGFPAGTSGERNASLDHGTIVPLFFIQETLPVVHYVRIGISGLSLQNHYAFGVLLQQAAHRLKRKVVIIASGDLSHKLTADGPYGYSPHGPGFDSALLHIMETGNFGKFFEIDPRMCKSAAECGLRSFVIMAGALDQRAVVPKLYSYEGPFGVGYAVASYRVLGEEPSRRFLASAQDEYAADPNAIRELQDPYVSLAREALEHYVKSGKRISLPQNLPEELTGRQAGVFVSIKKNGNLRGCIGTIVPTQKNVACEIICNAIASGTDDPRFSPVAASELADLAFSVDILFPAEPVTDRAALDVKRYGVIVTRGMRRGLLLPNLDGIDTVEMQLEIACQKAGIHPSQDYAIERFEVVRHT